MCDKKKLELSFHPLQDLKRSLKIQHMYLETTEIRAAGDNRYLTKSFRNFQILSPKNQDLFISSHYCKKEFEGFLYPNYYSYDIEENCPVTIYTMSATEETISNVSNFIRRNNEKRDIILLSLLWKLIEISAGLVKF